MIADRTLDLRNTSGQRARFVQTWQDDRKFRLSAGTRLLPPNLLFRRDQAHFVRPAAPIENRNPAACKGCFNPLK